MLAHYDGTSETEERIKEETKATIRCLALNEADEDGVCIDRPAQPAAGVFCPGVLAGLKRDGQPG